MFVLTSKVPFLYLGFATFLAAIGFLLLTLRFSKTLLLTFSLAMLLSLLVAVTYHVYETGANGPHVVNTFIQVMVLVVAPIAIYPCTLLIDIAVDAVRGRHV